MNWRNIHTYTNKSHDLIPMNSTKNTRKKIKLPEQLCYVDSAKELANQRIYMILHTCTLHIGSAQPENLPISSSFEGTSAHLDDTSSARSV
jgi:hypothetical protein